MREHPNAVVVRRAYESRARATESDDDPLTPLALAAAGDLVVVIDHRAAHDGLDPPGVSMFEVRDGRIVAQRRVVPNGSSGAAAKPRA